MNKQEQAYKRVYRVKFKISMIFFILLLTVIIILGVNVFGIIKQNKIVKQNNIVEAPAIDYRVIGLTHTAYPQIGFYYEYIDDNGIKYSGSTTKTVVYGYEAAEEAIENGLTIKIYIDGKGNSFPVGAEASKQQFIAILVSALILIVFTVVFFIIFLVPKKIGEKQK